MTAKNGNGKRLNGHVSVMSLVKTGGTVLALLVTFGTILGAYFKGQQELKDEIAELQLELQTQREEDRMTAQEQHWTLLNRIDTLEQNVNNESLWVDKAIDEVADAIPNAMEKHFIYDHPKKGGAASMTETHFDVVLPTKPKKVESKLPVFTHPSELDLMKKKKAEMAAAN